MADATTRLSTGRGFFNRYTWSYTTIQGTEDERATSTTTGQVDDRLKDHRRLYLVVGTIIVLMSMGLAALVLGMEGGAKRSSSDAALRIKEQHAFSVMRGGDEDTCEDQDPDRTLKLVHEISLFALFDGENKYEASGVVVRGDYYYVICDSNWSIFQIHKDLHPSATGNLEITHFHDEDDFHVGDSQYESIYYDHVEKHFYLVREAIPHMSGDHFHAHIEKVDIVEKKDSQGVVKKVSHTLEESCRTEYTFDGDNKGLEGMMGFRDAKGDLYLLGLCEGNHCSDGAEGRDAGNGRMIVMKRDFTGDGQCQWTTVRLMNIPRSADFQDYSAVDYNVETGLVAIASQEESKLWIGRLINPDNSKTFDPHESYLEEEGTVYDFPRDDNCKVVYCNIEGVHWIGHNKIVTASDKAKGGGKQPGRCKEKDQSVHVFTIPL